MRRHSGLFILLILILIAIILGITASDLWDYILNFTKIAFNYACEWLKTVIYTIRDSLSTGLKGETSPEATTQIVSAISNVM